MTQVLYGPGISKQGKIRLGCTAAIFDGNDRILLTKRSDNGQWCLPGGAVDPGETVSEACVREVLEETGLQVRVKRLIGIYSHSDQLVVYPDGNKVQVVALLFEVEVTGGTAGLSDEVSDFGYFARDEMDGLEFLGRHRERVHDAYEKYSQPVIK
jgi:8-oxo-dGTP pyrophosphatase MutT (NUDIX family)